jgi:hypothetical protein
MVAMKTKIKAIRASTTGSVGGGPPETLCRRNRGRPVHESARHRNTRAQTVIDKTWDINYQSLDFFSLP